MKRKSGSPGCILFGLGALLLAGYFFAPFGGGKGPTTTAKIQAPTGEIVDYETYYVRAFQDPGREYSFYFQQSHSAPRERMGGTFPGPGEPIPLYGVKIHRFGDRIILIVNIVAFSEPDSYVFFHALPYEKGTWQILYNKRDNFRVFDRIENNGHILIEKGTSAGEEHSYNITASGQLEAVSVQTSTIPK